MRIRPARMGCTRRLPKAMLAVLALVTSLLAGCSGETGPNTTGPAKPELSPALAARDGNPTITVLSPADGETVGPTFTVAVEVSDLTLAAKGRTRDGEAHFHVLVDRDCMEPGVVIGDDDAIHVGSGAAEVEIELTPGPHSICVQLGDGFHVAVAVTDSINIVVDGNA